METFYDAEILGLDASTTHFHTSGNALRSVYSGVMSGLSF